VRPALGKETPATCADAEAIGQIFKAVVAGGGGVR
jgi:hypothetical protein